MKPDIVDELFRKYYNEALLYTMSVCRNKTIAEDVVSIAFYKALESADDSISNFKAWLLTVCRNEYISMYRESSRYTGEEIPDDVRDDTEELADGIIRGEEYKALYHAIGLLPDNYREAIMLFYFSALSIKEIADVLGKSEANVKVLLHRGREQLKALLEGNI